MKSTSHKAPHYSVFSSLLHCVCVRAKCFLPASWSQTPSTHGVLYFTNLCLHFKFTFMYHFNKTELYNMHFLVPKESSGQHINALHLVNSCQLTSVLQPPHHDHTADWSMQWKYMKRICIEDYTIKHISPSHILPFEWRAMFHIHKNTEAEIRLGKF